MILFEKTEGEKIPYSQMEGNLLVLDNTVYLNLEMYERDFPVQLDICRNDFGMLTMGISRAYVAQIDIPAREYVEVDTGEVDEDNNPVITREPQPFDMNKVTLTLWGVN